MIDHLSLPVSDYALSRTFYDKALGALGYKVQMEATDALDYIGAGYGPADLPEPAFWIGAGREPGSAPVTPIGQHVAFKADGRAAVDAFYATALAAAGVTMAHPDCARSTIRATMPPSSSTPMDTASRRSAIVRSKRR